jgi:hypothetical protein
MADLAAGRALLTLRAPYSVTTPGPLLSGALFLVLGQGRWSGFRLTSGFPMPAAPPGPFLPVKDGLLPSSLVPYAEPLLLDWLLLVLAQERWAGILLASRFPIDVAVEAGLRTIAPVAALRSLPSRL